MPSTIFRGTLFFRHTKTGLGWSITCVREEADPDAFQTSADAFMGPYMAACQEDVELVGFRVSIPGAPGGYTEYSPASFVNKVGQIAGIIVPVAEAVLARGDDANTFVTGHSRWWLHGLETTLLSTSGEVNQAAAAIIALTTAAKAYLYNYRKTATPVPPAGKGWPVVSPPQAFAEFAIAGPYVRRLGQGFFRAGQHRRYKT